MVTSAVGLLAEPPARWIEHGYSGAVGLRSNEPHDVSCMVIAVALQWNDLHDLPRWATCARSWAFLPNSPHDVQSMATSQLDCRRTLSAMPKHGVFARSWPHWRTSTRCRGHGAHLLDLQSNIVSTRLSDGRQAIIPPLTAMYADRIDGRCRGCGGNVRRLGEGSTCAGSSR